MARVRLVALLVTILAVSATAARLSSAEDFVATTCSVALDTLSRCSASLPADQLAASCCTPHAVLTNFNCFCDPAFKEQAQGMLTTDVRQATLQCPGKGHVSEPIYCNAKNQQVTYWSDDKLSLQNKAHIMDTTLIPTQIVDNSAEIAETSFVTTHMVACGGKPQIVEDSFTMPERRSDAETQGSNMVVELSVADDPTTDEVTERSYTFTKPAVLESVADLTAEVDFEIGPDVTRGEVEQILRGVTDWVKSMVDDSGEPFGDAAMVQHSGELSSITAHVAEVISQMAGSLANPDQVMDLEITYEFDLGAPEYGEFMSQDLAADDLAALRDSMTSAAADAAVVDSFSPRHHGHVHHMGHHMNHHKHRCFMQKVYGWLCHHKGFIQMALAVELVLCAVFGIVHLAWSCLARDANSELDDSEEALKKPLIEHASAYHLDGHITISPLWAHVMDSKSAVSVV